MSEKRPIIIGIIGIGDRFSIVKALISLSNAIVIPSVVIVDDDAIIASPEEVCLTCHRHNPLEKISILAEVKPKFIATSSLTDVIPYIFRFLADLSLKMYNTLLHSKKLHSPFYITMRNK